MVAMLFAVPVWVMWIGAPLLLLLLTQLLLSYVVPERLDTPRDSSEPPAGPPAARWPRPVRPPKVTRRLILPRAEPYAPRPFVVYRRPIRRTRPVATRPVATRPVAR